MTIASGTPFDDLLAQLTERMGVLHTASPDVDPSQRDRVEWKNSGVSGLKKRGYRKPGTVTTGFQGVKYDVAIYGATELEALARASQLVGWLDYLIGPPQGAADAGDGFDIGDASVPVRGGDGNAAGFACVLPVTLYQPIYREIQPARLVLTHPIAVIATAPDGSAGEHGPPEATRPVQ